MSAYGSSMASRCSPVLLMTLLLCRTSLSFVVPHGSFSVSRSTSRTGRPIVSDRFATAKRERSELKLGLDPSLLDGLPMSHEHYAQFMAAASLNHNENPVSTLLSTLLYDPYLKEMKSIAPMMDSVEGAKQGLEAIRGGGTGGQAVMDLSNVKMMPDVPNSARNLFGHVNQYTEAVKAIPEAITQEELRMEMRDFDVLQRLPGAALFFVLVEFFLVRGDDVIYNEDLEEDKPGVVADSLYGIAVRVGGLTLVGFFTMLASDIFYKPPF